MSERHYVDRCSSGRSSPQSDRLAVGDKLDDDNELAFRVLDNGAWSATVWLNKEQIRDLRDRLSRLLGDAPAALVLWHDE